MKSVHKVRIANVALLVLAALLTIYYVASGGGGFPLDDSWIHQTYGRNLAETGMWAFIPGVPSAASTSPLYTVVLAIGYWLRVPFALWTHGMGALALGITAIVGSRMAEQAAPRFRGIGFITGLTLVIAWHLVWAAASGMETMLFSMLTMLVMWLAWREARADGGRVALRGIVFGVTAALATLARPEGVMLAGFAGLLLLVARANVRWLLLFGGAALAAFLLVLSPYLVYNLQITGGLLPNTAAAKQAWVRTTGLYEVNYLWRYWNLLLPLAAGGQVLLVPGMVIYLVMSVNNLRQRRADVVLLLPLVWGLGLIALYAATLPLPFQHGRYVIPALPAWIFCGVVGTAHLLHWGRRAMITRVLTRAVAFAAALMFVFFAFLTGVRAYAQDVAIINQEMVDPAHWIASHIPPDEILAVHDIGAVGYFAPRPILDIAGLVSPEFVPAVGNAEAMWTMMQAGGARYLMAMPDQLPGDDITDSRLCPVYTSDGTAALTAGGLKMMIYVLAWDGECS